MSDEASGRDVQFETVASQRVQFGKSNFIEIARKRAVSNTGTTEFISISRGYIVKDGSDRFKSSITIPDEPEVLEFLVEQLQSI